MLAVFLTGIATGSIVMNRHVDKLKKPLVVFGILEMLIGVISIANLYFFQPLAYNTFTRLIAPVILVFPLTFLFGAIFPGSIVMLRQKYQQKRHIDRDIILFQHHRQRGGFISNRIFVFQPAGVFKDRYIAGFY